MPDVLTKYFIVYFFSFLFLLLLKKIFFVILKNAFGETLDFCVFFIYTCWSHFLLVLSFLSTFLTLSVFSLITALRLISCMGRLHTPSHWLYTHWHRLHTPSHWLHIHTHNDNSHVHTDDKSSNQKFYFLNPKLCSYTSYTKYNHNYRVIIQLKIRLM